MRPLHIPALLAVVALAGCEIEFAEHHEATGELMSDAAPAVHRVPVVYPASLGGTACRSICNAIAAMGCVGVGHVCAVGTVVTVGSIAVPCTWATMAACGIAAGSATVCGEMCPP